MHVCAFMHVVMHVYMDECIYAVLYVCMCVFMHLCIEFCHSMVRRCTASTYVHGQMVLSVVLSLINNHQHCSHLEYVLLLYLVTYLYSHCVKICYSCTFSSNTIIIACSGIFYLCGYSDINFTVGY